MSDAPAMAWPLVALFGLSYGTYQTVYFALSMNYTDLRIAASMFSILMAFSNVAQGVGMALSGVLAATSVCFDLSVFELFLPLSVGGSVILADNVLAAIRRVGPYAVDVSSGVEETPGVKDHAKMTLFFQQLADADRRHAVFRIPIVRCL